MCDPHNVLRGWTSVEYRGGKFSPKTESNVEMPTQLFQAAREGRTQKAGERTPETGTLPPV